MIEERLRTLAHYLGAPRLAEASAIKNRRRWQTAATDLNIKKELRTWRSILPIRTLAMERRGRPCTARGQVAPGYEEADAKLAKPSAG